MKLKLKSVLGGAGALAITGGMLLAGATAAHAATPTYEPDPNAVGTVAFYDASGNQITHGSIDDSPQAVYYVASGNGVATGDNIAQMAYATPQDGVNSASWTTVETWTAGATYGTGVSYPGSLAGSAAAIAKGAATDGPLSGHITNFPSSSTANPNVYQVRILTSHAGSAGNAKYYASDVLVDPTAKTWTQVYPTPPVIATATSISTPTASPVSPAPHGSTVTLSATLTAADGSHPAGTVHLFDGSTDKGAATFTASSGAITATDAPADGTHSYTFQFTPGDNTSKASTSPALSYSVVPATSTALTVTGADQTGTNTVLTATVTPSAAPGTVAFTDNGTALAGTVTQSSGTYTLTITGGVAAGSHSFVATFTPTNSTQYASSQSAPVNVNTVTAGSPCTQPGSQCTTTANVKATVNPGTLVINTPYTSSSPLDLGALKLSADSKLLQGSAPFANIVVTDTRAGNLPWTITALASNLDDSKGTANSIINAQNLGLTGITSTAGSGFSGVVTATDNAAALGVAPTATGSAGLGGTVGHTVAAADHGLGTVTLQGTLSLNAPSSTEAGIFHGTITLTVG